MKKVIIIIISVIVGLVILIRIPINLHRNAYYYATHMPHKSNQYPFITLLNGFYLPSSYVPGYKSRNLNASSIRDPIIMQIEKKSIKTQNDMIAVEKCAVFYLPTKGEFANSDIISFNGYGDYNDYSTAKDVPAYSRKLLLAHLNNIQSEIKQNALKPKVNLQWIWNVWFKIHYR
ncbi:hypothetical protein FOD75_11080 (plasmid) [Limosilactobacillus reuteri]|uniref:Uncharacterized protein n=1 Tax=Limosilactobacillus reuteri TaxID=1598 RepID=A0A517D8E9_LIMRT|nr:hypothetical protein [Limosilactobacillus reuteri]QDR73632.1 hypothetical protein FOD75_11080 [Limosilactobacillus reuteri]